ncbi:MAG: ammonium transporter [Saprospiraceae bacterium]|nr:ammonium transporter [Saprospiraceae bacterium]
MTALQKKLTNNSRNVASFIFLVFIALSAISAFYPSRHPEGGTFEPSNIAFMLSAAGLVLLMTPGLSFFYGGMVNAKSIISTMLQSFVALGLISLLWYVVGFSLAFGDDIGGIIGNPMTFLFFDNVGLAPHDRMGTVLPFALYAAFQLKFAIITPALITGSFAERVRFWGYVIFICLFSLLIYCPLAHMTWHPDGLFFKMGVLDFAGGTVVHISAGFAALAGAIFLGRRKSHLEQRAHTPVNVPYVVLGTGLLWFGWFGFNAGSALESNTLAVLAFINTNLASASAMFAWMLFDTVRGKKASAVGACVAAVVGLVAITPAAGFVSFGSSIFIGVVAAIVCNYAVHRKTKSDLDDTLDVFPCHGVGGIVGMILTAVFATEGGLVAGETSLFFSHLLALAIVSAFTFFGSLALYRFVSLFTPMRVTEEEEAMGLDITQHQESVFAEEAHLAGTYQ